MPMQIASGPPQEKGPHHPWYPEPGEPAYGTNFYTSSEPYERRRVTITHMEMRGQAEARERACGCVPFDELPRAVQEMWAKRDAEWLAASVLSHLASR